MTHKLLIMALLTGLHTQALPMEHDRDGTYRPLPNRNRVIQLAANSGKLIGNCARIGIGLAPFYVLGVLTHAIDGSITPNHIINTIQTLWIAYPPLGKIADISLFAGSVSGLDYSRRGCVGSWQALKQIKDACTRPNLQDGSTLNIQYEDDDQVQEEFIV